MVDVGVTMSTLDDGTIEYRNAAGEKHRVGGPAVVFPDGEQRWYLNGKLHRENGPASVWDDGTEEWYLHGKPHRTDGPAVVYSSGDAEWILYGGCLVKMKSRYRRVHVGKYSLPLNTSLVKQVMRERGIASLEGFCSWLAFDVLGEEAVPVLAAYGSVSKNNVAPLIEEYLLNLESYEGLPFSWWYPIVGRDEVGK